MTIRMRKSAKDRKAEIVDAVIRLSGEIGPDRLTTDQLAKEIGISQAGIFRHFPTKGKIWEAVGQRIAERVKANAESSMSPDSPPVDQLKSFVINHLDFITRTPAVPAILFSRELHAENDELRSLFANLILNRQRSFSKLIQSEIEAGMFRADLNSNDAAYLILALVQGLAMRWSLYARNFDLVGEGKRLLEMQLEGLRASNCSPQSTRRIHKQKSNR